MRRSGLPTDFLQVERVVLDAHLVACITYDACRFGKPLAFEHPTPA